MKLPRILSSILFCLSLGTWSCFADPPKVIIDTDFNTIGDDGQVAVMAAQLYSQGVIDLLGFTIPSGNQWRDQGVSDCLKAVERLGIEHRVRVYVGSQYPLLHDYKSYLYEEQSFGEPIDYVGAYASPQPSPNQLVPPPDGFATHTRPAKQDAVDFIIETVHRYPHQVTILEIAPPTNMALAIRKDPTIVPLTETVFDQITQHNPQTIITELFEQANAPFFGPNPPPFVPYIYDTTAFAFFVHPEFATDVRDLWVDMHTTFDQDYGRSIPSTTNPYPNISLLQDSKVIFHLDNAQFYAFYVDLLTRPVPVRFKYPWCDF